MAEEYLMSVTGNERRDYMLQVQRDLNRYEYIYNIMQTFAQDDQDTAAESMVPEMVNGQRPEPAWPGTSWDTWYARRR